MRRLHVGHLGGRIHDGRHGPMTRRTSLMFEEPFTERNGRMSVEASATTNGSSWLPERPSVVGCRSRLMRQNYASSLGSSSGGGITQPSA